MQTLELSWIAWNRALAESGASESGLERLVEKYGLTVFKIAGGRVLRRSDFIEAFNSELERADRLRRGDA